jgi:hypothetical protein
VFTYCSSWKSTADQDIDSIESIYKSKSIHLRNLEKCNRTVTKLTFMYLDSLN